MKNFNLPPLYPIANLQIGQNSLPYIHKLISSGIKILQLRAKEHSTEEFSRIANQVLSFAKENNPGLILIINDALEVLKNSNAAGLHLGQEDISPKVARKLIGPDKVIGLSTHSLNQIITAEIEFLDYLAIGPIFHSITKSELTETVGLTTLKEAVKISKLPLVAIGGINLTNAKEVFQTGVKSIAGISEFEKAKDLKKLILEYDNL